MTLKSKGRDICSNIPSQISAIRQGFENLTPIHSNRANSLQPHPSMELVSHGLQLMRAMRISKIFFFIAREDFVIESCELTTCLQMEVEVV
jgi:hypothetical protein